VTEMAVLSRSERILIVLVLLVAIAIDVGIARGVLSADGPDLALESAGVDREGDVYRSRLVVRKGGGMRADEVAIEAVTVFGERLERKVRLERSETPFTIETNAPLESVRMTAPDDDVCGDNDRVEYEVWSREVRTAETNVLPDPDVALIDGQVWIAYTKRVGGAPGSVFLQVNDASTGEEIASVEVSDAEDFTWDPGIVPDLRMVYWETRVDDRLCVQYVRVDEDLRACPPVTIHCEDCDLTHPVAAKAHDGNLYLIAAWEREGAFGFRAYALGGRGPRKVVDGPSVWRADRDELLYNPTIKGLEAFAAPQGFVVVWLETEGATGHVNFFKMSYDGEVLVPRREIVKYYMAMSYWRDFEVAFLPEGIHVFWTEMNNRMEQFYQVSRVIVDYEGDELVGKRIVAEPDVEFRGDIDVAVGPGDLLHLVWVDQNPLGSRANRDVFYRRFDAEGGSLGEPEIVVLDASAQKSPRIFIADDGERVLQWSELGSGYEGERRGYVLFFKSTRPELIAGLKEADKISTLGERALISSLYLTGGVAAAVPLSVPLNVLPLLSFALFYYVLLVAGRIEHSGYYLLFPALAFPAKFYNDVLFTHLFRVSAVGDRYLLLTSAASLAVLAVVGAAYHFGNREWYFGRFRFWFAVLLFLDTVAVATKWICSAY